MGPPPGLFAELSRWRDKASKRGKPCDFNSDIIPEWLSAEVKSALDVVGVDEAFSFLKQVDPERMRRERALRRELGVVFNEFKDEYIDAVEAGEEPDNEELERALTAALMVMLTSTYVEEALRVSAEIGVQYDPAAIGQAALEWARGYTFDLVGGLTNTTRNVVRNAITTALESPGMTREQIAKLLESAFSPARAESISITELTRAYSAATEDIRERLLQAGVVMVEFWITREDELVCPICGPLHEQPESVWKFEFPTGPPAHPRCRGRIELRPA